MIINKYTWWRKLIFVVQRHFAPAKRLKNISPRFKHKKYKIAIQSRLDAIHDMRAKEGKFPPFTKIEIETINRCNGTCSFCPVNRHIDTRERAKMEDTMFFSIIDQLKSIDYGGRICLYSNNEPLLDKRIAEFAIYARTNLPRAFLELSTNGLLLTENIYKSLIDSVDVLVVDNYCDDFVFRPNIEEIIALSSTRPDWEEKTRVTMRYINEVMTSRGGTAPNKVQILNPTLPFGCASPLHDFVVRPNGKISLCCNDALGSVTLGDLSQNTLQDIWNDAGMWEKRIGVGTSRNVFEVCRHCDTMNK